MQRAYISKLMELAEMDRNVLHLVADSGTGFDEMFKINFPGQMYNFGIAEEHMVGAAAGMATAGKMPFVYTAGAFLAYRAFEFIRNDLCFQNLNVKVVGMGSGLTWSTLGPTHHTTEDISVLRAIPNLMILSPGTPIQVAACLEAAYRYNGPVYIKIGMNNEKEFFQNEYVLPEGKNEVLLKGEDIALYTTGCILEEAWEAAMLLSQNGISTTLINVHSIKPFDRENVYEIGKKVKKIYTVEEHNIYGGLGSIISEIVAEENLNIPLKRIGLKDDFAVGYGTYKEVLKQNKLDADGIYESIMRDYCERIYD
ncbi:MAG: transketolase C-terminal domain-containing protein [Lachnospiraceae bacterium]|nr:transketolase C-terminal domain-containing protein [Lachnospiraceae bacterium]